MRVERLTQPLLRSVYRAALAQGKIEAGWPLARPQRVGWATGKYGGLTRIVKPGRVRASGYFTFRTVSEGSPAMASWVIRKAHEKRERDDREEELQQELFERTIPEIIEAELGAPVFAEAELEGLGE
jgi:hypothetical protein